MEHIDHKLDSFFGPSGTFAGYVLLAAGAFTIKEGYGAILIFIGALMAFTYIGAEIDRKNNRYRSYSKWLGLIKSGKWRSLDEIRELKVIHSQVGHTSYSLGNRPLDIKKKDYRIIMQGDHLRDKVVVMAVKSLEDARTEAHKLSSSLGIPIV